MSHRNTIGFKPHYNVHRKVSAVDSANLATLETSTGRAAVNAKGFNSLHGYVSFEGGTTPSITLQPLERVTYLDDAEVEHHVLIERGSSIGPLSGVLGAVFDLDTPGGGCWLFRVSALTGSPTSVTIHLAGGLRANEGSI